MLLHPNTGPSACSTFGPVSCRYTWEAVDDGSGACVPATYMGNLALGFCPILVLSQQVEDLSLCHSTF